MTHCWNQDPARRPSFKQLVSVLAGMVSDNADYLQVRIIRGAKRPVFNLCLHFVGEVA